MDKNQEILIITMEECSEVIQATSKCYRFGFDNISPERIKTNREHLEEEVGDLMAMVQLMIKTGIVNEEKVQLARYNKIEKLKKWSTLFDE